MRCKRFSVQKIRSCNARSFSRDKRRFLVFIKSLSWEEAKNRTHFTLSTSLSIRQKGGKAFFQKNPFSTQSKVLSSSFSTLCNTLHCFPKSDWKTKKCSFLVVQKSRKSVGKEHLFPRLLDGLPRAVYPVNTVPERQLWRYTLLANDANFFAVGFPAQQRVNHSCWYIFRPTFVAWDAHFVLSHTIAIVAVVPHSFSKQPARLSYLLVSTNQITALFTLHRDFPYQF